MSISYHTKKDVISNIPTGSSMVEQFPVESNQRFENW